MVSDYWGHVARKPRHEVAAAASIRVEIRGAGGSKPCPIEGELLDLSRSGIRLRVDFPLNVGESIVVRLHSAGSRTVVTLPCRVQWRRHEHENDWQIGCLTLESVDWETMGELFLSGVLREESTAADTGV